MPNDTTIPTPADNSAGEQPAAYATVMESGLGDLVSFWSSWDHEGCTFPVEDLPAAIDALQRLQAELNGPKA